MNKKEFSVYYKALFVHIFYWQLEIFLFELQYTWACKIEELRKYKTAVCIIIKKTKGTE